MKLIVVGIAVALIIAGCARMPRSMVSEDGSALRFADNSHFTYTPAGMAPTQCQRTPDPNMNTMNHLGIAVCDDGSEGQFERLTGLYFAWIEADFDGRRFFEPGKKRTPKYQLRD